MYSGNMGLGHRFEEFLTAATSAAMDVRFVFAGRGKQRSKVEKFTSEKVEVLDYVSNSDLAVHLASADVHLVSLEPSWNGSMVPSKLQGIFAIGRPVIFVGSPSSTIGQWITESGGGWVIEPDDHKAMKSAIEQACDPAERACLAEKAAQFSHDHFNRTANSQRTASFFTQS